MIPELQKKLDEALAFIAAQATEMRALEANINDLRNQLGVAQSPSHSADKL